jgi:hypothetical protein
VNGDEFVLMRRVDDRYQFDKCGHIASPLEKEFVCLCQIPTPVEEGAFFLTSLFIELIDPGRPILTFYEMTWFRIIMAGGFRSLQEVKTGADS